MAFLAGTTTEMMFGERHCKNKYLVFPQGRIRIEMTVPGQWRPVMEHEKEKRRRGGWFCATPRCDMSRYHPEKVLQEMEAAFERSWRKVPLNLKSEMYSVYKKHFQAAKAANVQKVYGPRIEMSCSSLMPERDAWHACCAFYHPSFTVWDFPFKFWPQLPDDQERVFLQLWLTVGALASGAKYRLTNIEICEMLESRFLPRNREAIDAIIKSWQAGAPAKALTIPAGQLLLA